MCVCVRERDRGIQFSLFKKMFNFKWDLMVEYLNGWTKHIPQMLAVSITPPTGEETESQPDRVTCWLLYTFSSVQFSSVAQSCPTLRNPLNRSTPGLPVLHQLPEFTQTHVHRVSNAIHPSHPLSSPSPLAPNPSQHQSLFQWDNSSHEVAKVLELQL